MRTQSIEALRLANQVRYAKAAIKHRVRQAENRSRALTLVGEALESRNGSGALTLAELLSSVPMVGPVRVERIVKRLAVSPSRRVGDLTVRQRRCVLVELREAGGDRR